MNEEVKSWIAEVAGLTKTALAWEQKLRFLSQHRGRRATAPRPESDGGPRPLSVTGRATSALKDMLDGMAHEPGQALRLALGSGGGMTLVLDTERAGDNVVSHEGEPVLLIDSPVPEDLQGSTLDISEKPEGSTIVLSH